MQTLRLSPEQMQAIVNHVRNEQPYEACGIIAGNVGVVSRIIPIKNVAVNAEYHYQMDAQELLQTLKAIDFADEEMLGVYHSHPNNDPIPSSEDLREAQLNTPNMVHVIVSLKYAKARLQAWHIHDGQANKIELLVGNKVSMSIVPMTKAQIIVILVAMVLAVLLVLMISFYLLPPAPPIPTPQ